MTDSGSDRLSDRRPPQASDPEREPVEPPRFPEPRSLLPGAERRVEVKPAPVDRQTRTLEVSEVLPDAIANSAGDPHLARALAPAIEQALTASARRDPRPLVDALMPVIGRALRKSIAQTLAPLITLGAAALLVAGVWTFQGFRERQVWNDYVERLGAEPGIVVIQSGRQDGKYLRARPARRAGRGSGNAAGGGGIAARLGRRPLGAVPTRCTRASCPSARASFCDRPPA